LRIQYFPEHPVDRVKVLLIHVYSD